jgi:hypothetical protein
VAAPSKELLALLLEGYELLVDMTGETTSSEYPDVTAYKTKLRKVLIKYKMIQA